MAFINALPLAEGNETGFYKWLIIGGVVLIGLGALIFIFRKNERFRKIVQGFKNGLLSIFKLEHSFQFIGLSILIWLLYFVMSYFVIIAFPETEVLEFGAVLTLFAMGAIAMAAPLPGGAGSYHTIVPLGLVMLYGLPKGDAIAFVFIFHAWQTFIMIVAGVVSLIISYSILKWKR
jgi:LPXTG-motif cell wall-anchored protein